MELMVGMDENHKVLHIDIIWNKNEDLQIQELTQELEI
jgi:hypothetical protein